MPLQFFDFWSWRGTVGRAKYFAIGVTLFAVKHLLDRIVATYVFGRPWSLFNYWVISGTTGIEETPEGQLRFYGTLVALALPFIWVGVVLTLRRLRSIGWPLWLVTFFFFPFVNLFFFLLLSTVPACEDVTRSRFRSRAGAVMDSVIPRSGFGSAVAGIVVTTLLTIGTTTLSALGLGQYGWGLFVGLPFCLGLSSVLVYGYHEPRPLGRCLLVALLSVGLAGAALIAVAIEGLVCVVMALPLGVVMALFGGLMAYIIQNRPHESFSGGYTLHTLPVIILALPLLVLLDGTIKSEPALREVTTTLEINAPPEKVWQHLVAFTEIPRPQEGLFQTGIAYPIRAEIHGHGVGSVRHCVFSTGAFIEPIEVWDEPQLLRFGVTAQPPVMEELSPYNNLRPPHLNHYLQSRKGQFHLSRLPNGHTLLEGTTWYENSFWPAVYWNLWSDYIIHRIHRRVLDHIKRSAEQ